MNNHAIGMNHETANQTKSAKKDVGQQFNFKQLFDETTLHVDVYILRR